MSTSTNHARKADYPVASPFVERWSSRSFEDKDVPEDVLLTVLEAGRWAPSGGNGQPWRFVVARTPEQRERFLSFINEGNRVWAQHAPVLILIVSERVRPDGKISGSHAFDAGAAWASIALQAHQLGLATRAMGGFDRELAREKLHVPAEYELQAVVALGYRGAPERLEPSLRERELPSPRRPLADSIIEGAFA